ncbi:MAG TPA: hypothetical protein VM290_11250 [Gaiellaceae bacterium]|nr:hypothetical protein [Gaiellaceae bacterium]
MPRVDEADELYGLPLDEFVAARTALARRLRQDGRADDAAEVAGLRKPTVPLWAVNQLARRRGREVAALLEAAERLRSGGADGADDRLRRSLAALVRSASDVLEEGGHAASDATLQRVGTTLRAAAASDGEERELLRRGALDRELEPTGFEAMAALAASASPPPRRSERRADGAAAKRRARVEAAEAALREARARARDLAREADRAEREATRARTAAERAAADVEKGERALARARS